MDLNNQNLNNVKPWWKQGIQIFTKVSSYILIPIIFALFLGKKLDFYFNTKPIIFLVCIGISFIISSFGILRVIKNYINNLKNISNKEK